jgi:hypothetical protein
LAGATGTGLLLSVLLGYHRLLGQVPTLAGGGTQGWLSHRSEVSELVARLSHVDVDALDDGPARWRRLLPELAPIFARIGVPAVVIRRGPTEICAVGRPEGQRAWLDLVLPDGDGVEIRLALSGLSWVEPERQQLLERMLVLLAGSRPSRRTATAQSSEAATVEDEERPDVPAERGPSP